MDDSDKSAIDEFAPPSHAKRVRRKRRKKRTSDNRNPNPTRSTSQSDFAYGERSSKTTKSASTAAIAARTSIGSISSSSTQYNDIRTGIRRKPKKSSHKNSLENSTVSDKPKTFITGVPEIEVKSETRNATTKAETDKFNDEKQSEITSETKRKSSDKKSNKGSYNAESRDVTSSYYDKENGKQMEAELTTVANGQSRTIKDSYQNAPSQVDEKYHSVNTRRNAADKSTTSNSVISSEKSVQSSKAGSAGGESRSEGSRKIDENTEVDGKKSSAKVTEKRNTVSTQPKQDEKSVKDDENQKAKKKKKCKKPSKKCQHLIYLIFAIDIQLVVVCLGVCGHGHQLAKSVAYNENIGLWTIESNHHLNLDVGRVCLIAGNVTGLCIFICLCMCTRSSNKPKPMFIALTFFAFAQYFALLMAIWMLGHALRREFQEVGYSYILPLVAFVLAHFTLSCPFVPACINPAWLDQNKNQKKESTGSAFSVPNESKTAGSLGSYREARSFVRSSRNKRKSSGEKTKRTSSSNKDTTPNKKGDYDNIQ